MVKSKQIRKINMEKGDNIVNKYTFTCDYAFLDQSTKLCINGIFDKITFSNPKQPYIHNLFYIVNNLEIFNPGSYEKIIFLVDPKGNEKPLFSLKINKTSSTKEFFGTIYQLINYQFNDLGEYKVVIKLNELIVDEIKLLLLKNEP